MKSKPNKALQHKAAVLARKFFDDAQRLFDDPAMDEDTKDSGVFQALRSAQGDAEYVFAGMGTTKTG